MGKVLAHAAAILALALACGSVLADPVEGRDYERLDPPQPVTTGANIEVREFFYYGCPICYEAQPHIARWLRTAGPGVALVLVPAVFESKSSESFARTFYALAALGQIGRLNWPIYDNHQFDGKKLDVEANVDAWVEHNGVDGKRFRELWHSKETDARLAAARKMLETYDVHGVPTFVVDGRYVTSERMAGGVKQMMDVVAYLVGKAREDRGKK